MDQLNDTADSVQSKPLIINYKKSKLGLKPISADAFKVVVSENDKVMSPFGEPVAKYSQSELDEIPRMIMRDCAPFVYINMTKRAPKELRIPYPKVVFELGAEGESYLVIVTQRTHASVRIEFIRQDHEIPFAIGALVIVETRKGRPLSIDLYHKHADLTEEWLSDLVSPVLGFIAEYEVGNVVINAPTIVKQEVMGSSPVAEKKSQLTRLITGLVKVRRAHGGGTHASPCEHQRAGHWRTCASGKKVWVSATVVNRGMGAVSKRTYLIQKKN